MVSIADLLDVIEHVRPMNSRFLVFLSVLAKCTMWAPGCIVDSNWSLVSANAFELSTIRLLQDVWSPRSFRPSYRRVPSPL